MQMLAVEARASRDRWEAERLEQGMALQDKHGSPASDGPGDAAWQQLLAQIDRGEMNDPRMS